MKVAPHTFALFFALIMLAAPVFAQQLSGTLTDDTMLTAALSPWTVTASVTVPDGVTLTMEPGSSVYFYDNTGIDVLAGGRLSAVGSESQRIRLTRRPGTMDRWNGIDFENSMEDNVLAYVDMLYADRQTHIIDASYAKILLDHCTWNTRDRTIVELWHPYAVIQNCVFPSVDEVEVVHGEFLRDEEYLILIGNTFGSPLGYNDVIDFTNCKRPGPILQVYNNTFLGGNDDGLDLDGTDAYVEGNIFMNFHLGPNSQGTSNAIATGFRNGFTTDVVAVRNVFYNNDHAVLLKEDCYMYAENNTFIGADSAAINFSEWPTRIVDPGKGADFVGNIFWGNRAVFENQFAQPDKTDPFITMNQNLVESSVHNLGENNIDVDPQFVDPAGDFHLLPTSPALGAGPNGLDLGAYVPTGASISGEPVDSTTATNALLTVGGPGILAYKYAVNDSNGNWSEEILIAENPTIALNGLAQGQSYTVYVKGKNEAGRWQMEPEYTASKTWFVQYPAGVAQKPAQTPRQFKLYENYPNPFNSSTVIKFDLPAAEDVQLAVYDALGRLQQTVVNGHLSAGTFSYRIAATDWPSGVYYYRLMAGELEATKRFILVR